MRDGGFISATTSTSPPDRRGGLRRRRGCRQLVSEEYLMALERKAFCHLIGHPKTQERIMGMLNTGKPVRN
jgi:3-hydroxyacyl-CoA dehydrogenase